MVDQYPVPFKVEIEGGDYIPVTWEEFIEIFLKKPVGATYIKEGRPAFQSTPVAVGIAFEERSVVFDKMIWYLGQKDEHYRHVFPARTGNTTIKDLGKEGVAGDRAEFGKKPRIEISGTRVEGL